MSRAPVGGRVVNEESYEGECNLVEGKAMLFNAGPQRDADIEFILRHRWVGKRVRVTLVELLDDGPPTDGRASSEGGAE